jgi:hypothetical protein
MPKSSLYRTVLEVVFLSSAYLLRLPALQYFTKFICVNLDRILNVKQRTKDTNFYILPFLISGVVLTTV